MLTARSILKDAENRLAEAGIENPREAEYLFEYAFGTRHYDPRVTITDEGRELFGKLISERIGGVPYQYLIGKAPFLDMDLKVGRGVLIPRPETEILAELAAQAAGEKECVRMADLCSGTGCIGIAVSRRVPSAEVTCVEKSEAAFGYLSENCATLAPDIKCVNEDLFVFLPEHPEEFDIITCNPPYLTKREMDELEEDVRSEPEEALYGGVDGLDFYRNMKPLVLNALKKGGCVIFEGGDGQLDAISEIYLKNGDFDGEIIRDQFGNDRIFRGWKHQAVPWDS